MNYGKFGARMVRVEDAKLTTGRGCYVDDINLPGQAHGVLVYAPHPHARIRSIDTARALRSPGVLCVLTAADVAAQGLGGLPPLFVPETPEGRRRIGPCGQFSRRTRFATSAIVWRSASLKRRRRRATPPI
jgi:carbon-monoxide dehydrogenase large subunit